MSRRTTVAALVASALVAAPATASVPVTAADRVGALAAAADGSAWFTLDGRLAAGVLRPDGSSRSWRLPGGTDRALIAAAPTTGAWVLVPDERGTRVLRIGARGPRVVARLPGFAGRIVTAADGVWAAGRRGLWVLRDNRPPRRVARGSFGALAAASGGGVWVLRQIVARDGEAHDELERWTPDRRRALRRPLGIGPDEIADDGRGGVWATSIFETGFLRIDAATGRTTRLPCERCWMLHALAAAPDGEAVATGFGAEGEADVVVGTARGPMLFARRSRQGRPLAVLPDGRVVLGDPRTAHVAVIGVDGRARSTRLDLPAGGAAPRRR